MVLIAFLSQPKALRSRGAFFLRAFILSVWSALLCLSLLACSEVPQDPKEQAPTAASPTLASAEAHYVGSESCRSCHAAQFDDWQGSHHAKAMQPTNKHTVLGDFNNAVFRQGEVESRFFQRDGQYYVNTEGPDGKLADFRLDYTFGVEPLQQYLIAFPGGRMQALSIAWDSRPAAEGGQRWFHLFPDNDFAADDPLHWTGRYQNWNLQCAECHSTGLRKNYRAETDSYDTYWQEVTVGCEACHGPASAHIEATKSNDYTKGSGDTRKNNSGLLMAGDRFASDHWRFATPESRVASRVGETDPTAMNTCSACHARRSTLAPRDNPAAPLADTHRLALLTPPNYHLDGQQHDEVYVWSSFLQSRMAQAGVVCTDCHQPHTAKLREEGNALCSRCHNSEAYDSPTHHGHPVSSAGAQCVTCHMPEQTYMQVDARRDHGIRVPRPDLSEQLGAPDACTQCHTDKKPDWAAAAIDRWHGSAWRQRPSHGLLLQQAMAGEPGSGAALLQLALDTSQPAIVRATALSQVSLQPSQLADLRALLADPAPEVRIAAIALHEPVDPLNRALALAPLVHDPVRGVRQEAALQLADIPANDLPERHRAAQAAALAEYVQSQREDADWAGANVNLGNLALRQQRIDEAIAHFRRAVQLDPQLMQGWVNLADALRGKNDEVAAEQALRQGLEQLPDNAALLHTLGLTQVRRGQHEQALQTLAAAAANDPSVPRYSYVYAVALHSLGQPQQAEQIAHEALQRQPNDTSLLSLLLSFARERGDNAAALDYARRLQRLLPDDAQLQALIGELSAG